MLHLRRCVFGLASHRQAPCPKLVQNPECFSRAFGLNGRAWRVRCPYRAAAIKEVPLQPLGADNQHGELRTTPGPAVLVHPATSASSFKLNLKQLVALVEKGFEEHGMLGHDGAHLAAQLCSSPLAGVVTTDGGVDAALRRTIFGSNRLPPPKTTSFLELVWDALQDTTIMLLFGAGGISLALAAVNSHSDAADWIEGVAILVSVLIVVGVSSITNYQKEAKFRALNAIKDDIQVRVLRDGLEKSVSTYDLLVGDVVIVETGDIVAADGVMVDGEDMRVDESHMTGESDEVIKSLTGSTLLLSGSKVLEGYGRMLVLAVGPNSQAGRLAGLVTGQVPAKPSADAAAGAAGEAVKSGGGAQNEGESLKEDTFLMRKLETLASQIGSVGIGAAAAVLAINCAGYTLGLMHSGHLGEDMLAQLQQYLDFFITSVTILVVAVPEGLPLAVTLALAFSVQRMLADNNLVRHLDACETMASTTTICSDKTGTLTQNNMTVIKMWAAGNTYRVRSSRQGRTITLSPDMVSDSDASSSASDGRESTPGPHGTNPVQGALQQAGHLFEQLMANAPETLRKLLPKSAPREASSSSINSSRAGPKGSAPAANATVAAPKGRHLSPDAPWIGALSLSLDEDEDDAQVHKAFQPVITGGQHPSGSTVTGSLKPSSGSSSKSSQSALLPSTAEQVPAVPRAANGVGRSSSPPHRLQGDEDDGRAVLDSIQLVDVPMMSHVHLPHSIQKLMLHNIILNSTASIKHNPETGTLDKAGNRTECALLEFAMRLVDQEEGLEKLREATQVLQLIPFTSQRKRMSVLILRPDVPQDKSSHHRSSHPVSTRLLTKGAAELVLEHCSFQLNSSGSVTPLTPQAKQQLMSSFGQGGLRMLALAYRDLSLPSHALRQRTPAAAMSDGADGEESSSQLKIPAEQLERDLVLVVLVGLEDPLREDVPHAIQQCQRAGITVRMLTGDNARTATSIARQCGILPRSTDVDVLLRACASLQRPMAPAALPSRSQPRDASASQRPAAASNGNLPGLSTASSASSGEMSPPSSSMLDPKRAMLSYYHLSRMGSVDIELDEEMLATASYEPPMDGTGSSHPGSSRQPHDVPGSEGHPSSWREERVLLGSDADEEDSRAKYDRSLQMRRQQEHQMAALEISRNPLKPLPSHHHHGSGRVIHTIQSSVSDDDMVPFTSPVPQPGGKQQAAGGGKQDGQSRTVERWDPPVDQMPEVLVLEGPQFRALVTGPDGTMDLWAFRALWPKLRVMARCSPSDKYLLVSALKQLRQQSAAGVAAAMGDNTSELTQPLQMSADGPIKSSSRHAHSQTNSAKQSTAAAGASTSESAASSSAGAQRLAPLIEVVAMTGDGTNDAPALTAADVGFAMNSGTSIAKDAADILLMDDSFSSIVSAVKWGRNVYASVTKFLQFQLTANVVAVATACAGAIAFQASPLSAVQMLWVNLIMDSLASLALATEAPTESMLDLPPIDVDEPLVNPKVAKHIVGQAAFQLSTLYVLVFHGKELLGVDTETCNTIVFNTFVMMQLFNQLNCRKIRDEPDVLQGLEHHKLFCVILAAEVLMQGLIVQFGGQAFQTVPLSPGQWALCVGLGSLTLGVRGALRQANVESYLAPFTGSKTASRATP